MSISEDLIRKYNRPIPRYTSYPPANHFATTFGELDLLRAIDISNAEGSRQLSFYIHVPFCPRICHYCACNAYPMQTKQRIDAYMRAILSELDLILPRLDPTRFVSQIHYGGGTPTAVPLHWLREINEKIKAHHPLAPNAEIAIECHPGYLSLAGWQELIDAGFTRMSLGVQDFHRSVLEAVGRQPSRLPYHEIVHLLKDNNIEINLDLIYGLSTQTPELFRENIEKAIDLAPDRLVTFSYAHVPWVKEAQRKLEELGLPSPDDKAQMLRTARHLLHEAGYRSVGMDHFVRPHDALFIAQEEGKLHRNFQGYCTRDTTGQVYAVGVTAISQLAGAYAQNTKSISAYLDTIQAGHIPVERGYTLSSQEMWAGDIITQVMCNARLSWQDLSQQYGSSAIREKIYMNTDLLAQLQADGLIQWTDQGVVVTPEGYPFLRIVASAFDPMIGLSSEGSPYSLVF